MRHNKYICKYYTKLCLYMCKIVKIFILSSFIISCARVGSPSGGPKDITPPKFLSSKPHNLATHVSPNTKEIELYFDEYVILKDIAQQVIISPPPRVTPSLSPVGSARKYVTVRFHEPLLVNTTYNINFGSGIQDNNEGNKLNNFSYTFSTGDKIDSLQVNGTVKQSLKMGLAEPTMVSLYKIEKDKSGKDSINLKNKPYYISRVDSLGNYKLEHLHEGNYKLLAFNDLNLNLIPDTEKEIIGFITKEINPIHAESYDLILSPVKEPYQVIGAKQEGQGMIKVKFKGNPDKLTIIPVDQSFPSYRIDHQSFTDSLYVYFNNKEIKKTEKKFRIKLLVKYRQKADTVNLLYDNTLKSDLLLQPNDKEISPTSYFMLTATNYIDLINKDRIEVIKNSKPVNFSTEIDSLNAKKITIKFPVSYDSEYKVTIKDNAFQDFLNQKNKDTLSYIIKTRKQNEFGNLNIKIKNKPESKFFFQLLNEKYEIMENIYGSQDTFVFQNMRPGKYLIRILVDENNDGNWDRADIENFKPAEPTYLYPNLIEVRPLWDINEVWIL
jgi:hypothetical protein